MAEEPTTFRLNREERRTLERIVDNDFKGLKTEIDNRASQWLAEQLNTINEKYRKLEEGLTEAHKQTRLLREKFQQQFDTHVAKLREKGYVIDQRFNRGITPEVVVPTNFLVEGKNKKIQEVQGRFQRAVDRAQRNLEKQRLEAIRSVLLTGIASNEATEILDRLPDADTILAAALEEDTPKAVQA